MLSCLALNLIICRFASRCCLPSTFPENYQVNFKNGAQILLLFVEQTSLQSSLLALGKKLAVSYSCAVLNKMVLTNFDLLLFKHCNVFARTFRRTIISTTHSKNSWRILLCSILKIQNQILRYQELVDNKTKKYKTSRECTIAFEVDGPYRAMVLPASKSEGENIKKRYLNSAFRTRRIRIHHL